MQTQDQISGDELNKGGGAGGMPTDQMGAEGGLSGKAPGKPMNKGNNDNVDDEDDEDENAQKSMLNEEDLMKSMALLESVAQGQGDPDRRAELAQKATEGTLTKAEKAEFIELLGGQTGTPVPEPTDAGDDETLQRSFVEEFADNDTLKKGFEASPFLEQIGVMVADGLDDLRKSIVESEETNATFRSALAKSLKATAKVITDQGSLIKSMAQHIGVLEQRVETVEQTPNQRRSVPSAAAAAALKKGGMEEGEGPYEGLHKGQVLEGMNKLLEKSMSSGSQDMMAPCGQPLATAIAKFESVGTISRPMLEDVKTILRQ
jgi:hypothetical protein